MGGTVGALVGLYAGGRSVHETNKAERRAENRRNADEAKLLADRNKAKEDAESARLRKQREELSRRGRRASILTSAAGAKEEGLGSISRPEVTAKETLG